MSVRISAAVAACMLVGLIGCVSTSDVAEREAVSSLDRLEAAMTGHFTSAQQAAEDEAFFDVTLHMVPIWPERSDVRTRWLYVEQAMTPAAGDAYRPYRQRVYRLTDEGGALVSTVYELPGDPLEYAGAWALPELFSGLAPADLIEREGCAIVLLEGEGGAFVGSTNGDDCKSSLRGASYATSRVTIRPGVVESWDQGFDAEGKQVWGATAGGYVFRRVD